jgi:hypothetical protein
MLHRGLQAANSKETSIKSILQRTLQRALKRAQPTLLPEARPTPRPTHPPPLHQGHDPHHTQGASGGRTHARHAFFPYQRDQLPPALATTPRAGCVARVPPGPARLLRAPAHSPLVLPIATPSVPHLLVLLPGPLLLLGACEVTVVVVFVFRGGQPPQHRPRTFPLQGY